MSSNALERDIFLLSPGCLTREVEKHHLKKHIVEIHWMKNGRLMMAIFFVSEVLMLIRILALILVVSCSTTKPTPYKKEHKKEG